MSTAMKFTIVGGALFLLGLVTFLSAIGWYNGAVALEEGVKAQYQSNQAEYDTFWKKVQETAQVPTRYKDDFKDLLVSDTAAKYGPEGSQATFQWFQDREINFTPEMYIKVQNIIESGRNDFKRGQNELLDKQRVFRLKTRTFFGRMFASIFDVPGTVGGVFAPPKDADGDGRLTVLDYTIVTSAKTQNIFNTSQENEPVNVFSK